MKNLINKQHNENNNVDTDNNNVTGWVDSELSDIELDLAILTNYIEKNIETISEEKKLVKAKNYLKDYKITEDLLGKTRLMINILVMLLMDAPLRFYEQQELLKKRLEKIINRVDNSIDLINDECDSTFELNFILD